MTGLWVLLLVIFIAALPVLPVYLWFRSHVFPMSSLWFLVSLLAGVFSLFIAALLQALGFAMGNGSDIAREAAMATVLFNIFVRIALTEETGRLLALLLFFRLGSRFKQTPFYMPIPDQDASPGLLSFGAATGLLAGLGFAIIETASYGTMNINIALLRAFTAAPLHGACGVRVGMGAIMLKQTPIRAIGRFFSAVAIHGMYNFMVISPGIPRIFPFLISLLTFVSSIQVIMKKP